MSKRNDRENAAGLANLAGVVIDALRNIRRFLLQPSTHPDWGDLVQDMPVGLRAILDDVGRADEKMQRASGLCHEAQSRVFQIEDEIEQAEQADAETFNSLRASWDEAKAELAFAQRALESAVQDWRESGRALSDGENFNWMADYEGEKKKAWLSIQREVLRRRRVDLETAIAGHRHQLDALPGRLGLRHDERIKANSATVVLLRLAIVVESDPHADLLNLNLDELHEDVIHEMSVRACDHVAGEQAPTTSHKPSAADRLMAAAAALIREGIYDATQAELAKRAGCSSRELRRGRGKDVWESYVNACARPPEADSQTVAQSRQQRMASEKMRRERRSSGE